MVELIKVAYEVDWELVVFVRARGVWLCAVQLLFKKVNFASNAFGSLFRNKFIHSYLFMSQEIYSILWGCGHHRSIDVYRNIIFY